jgi:glycerol-3-phosphate cytidylyltransferase
MKTVITYGTYDLFHHGHLNLLRRAKALGDILIVGLSTDEFNRNEKSKIAVHSYEKRKAILESVAFVDRVIPEMCWQQKRDDVSRYDVNVFVMGDDWKGTFDELKAYGVDVVYLPRTPEISSSSIRERLVPNGESQNVKDISCIVTNYNGAAYLDKAIGSLLSQTRPPTEIVIADDASTDSSRRIIERYVKDYDHIRPIYRSRVLGVSQNRDMAIRAASCDWITTLDSDDWFTAEKLMAESRVLAANPDSVACSDTALVDPQEQYFDIIHTAPLCDMSVPQRVSAIVARKKMIPRDLLMPRWIYEDIGGLDHRLSMYEDWSFKIRLADHGIPFVHSGISGTSYFRRGSGLSSSGQGRHVVAKVKALHAAAHKLHHPFAFCFGVLQLFFLKGPRKLARSNRPDYEII